MAGVVDKKTGAVQYANPGDVDTLIDQGLVTILSGEMTPMIFPGGSVRNVPSSEYTEARGEGARSLTQQEIYNAADNKALEEKYTAPGQKAIAAAEGFRRGVDFGVTESVKKSLGHDMEDLEAREYWNENTAFAAEMAGSIIGPGTALKALRWTGKGVRAATKGGMLSRPGGIAASILESGAPVPSAFSQGIGEAAAKKLLPKSLDLAKYRGMFKAMSPAMIQGSVEGLVGGGIYAATENYLSGDPDDLALDIIISSGLSGVLGGSLPMAFGAVIAGKDIAKSIVKHAGFVANRVPEKIADMTLQVTDELGEATPKTIRQIIEEGKYTPDELAKMVEDSPEFNEEATEKLTNYLTKVVNDYRPESTNVLYGADSEVRQGLGALIRENSPLRDQFESLFVDQNFHDRSTRVLTDLDSFITDPSKYKSEQMLAMSKDVSARSGVSYFEGSGDDVNIAFLRFLRKGSKNTFFQEYMFDTFMRLTREGAPESLKKYDEWVDLITPKLEEITRTSKGSIDDIVSSFKNATTTTKVLPGKPPRAEYTFEELMLGGASKTEEFPGAKVTSKSRRKRAKLGTGPSPILAAAPDAPADLYEALVNAYDAMKNGIHDVFDDAGLPGVGSARHIGIYKFFSHYLNDKTMFGQSADQYKSLAEAFDAYKAKRSILTSGLKADLGEETGKGLAKTIKEVIQDARRGNDENNTLNKLEEISVLDKNFMEQVQTFAEGKDLGISDILAERTAAVAGINDTLAIQRIIATITPDKAGTVIGSAREAAQQVMNKVPHGRVNKTGVASILFASAAAAEPALAASMGVKGYGGYKLLQSINDPARQIKRIARVEKYREEAEAHTRKGVGKILKSFGGSVEPPSKAMALTLKASRAAVRVLNAYAPFSDDRRRKPGEHTAILTIRDLVNDTTAMEEALDDSTSALSDLPGVRSATKEAMAKGINTLHELTPASITVRDDPVTGEEIVNGPDYAFDKMAQVCAVFHNPIPVFTSSVASGTVTQIMCQAMKRLYPEHYARIVSGVREGLTDPRKREKLTMQDKMTMYKLTGIGDIIGLPMGVDLQGNFAVAGIEKRRQRGIASMKDSVDKTMTPPQEAMA